METVFLLWGVFLCCTFLYAGYRVMALLRNMSGILLQRDLGATQYKGTYWPTLIKDQLFSYLSRKKEVGD